MDDAVDPSSWCDRLGLRPVDLRVLTAGRSGSHVLAVDLADDVDVVVKVTTQPARLAAARREVRVLADLARRAAPCAPGLVAATSAADGVAVAIERCVPVPAAVAAGDDLWVGVAALLARLHRRVGDRPGDGLPAVLEHGDCHLDNVVRDRSGRLVLVDWQDARRGDGLRDLVFCWQRAEFAGARPPRGPMTTAYAAGRGLDPAALRPLLDRVELHLLRVVWPPYLSWGTDAGRAVMAARLAELSGGQEVRR